MINEERLKRNTDCVYFLASPLTCKKGNDCEFRHSEIARLNPRDCWFWPAGTCTNSNCVFRHPPLDGLSAATATVGKRRKPCFYFDQGYCTKGEKCIFMHGLAPAAVKRAALATETNKLSPKLSKPNDCMESIEKSSKRVCSLTSKLSLELKQEVHATQLDCEDPKSQSKVSSAKTCFSVDLQAGKVTDAKDLGAETCLSAELQGQATDALSRMPATPDNDAPVKSGSHESVSGRNKSKQVTVIDYSPNQVYPAADASVKLPSEEVDKAFSGKNECCEVVPGGKRLQRVDSPENRIYDYIESEEIWEESSFDVLVGDARTDPDVAYAEDPDCLASCNRRMDPVKGFNQRSIVRCTDLAKYDYSNYYLQGEFEVQSIYDRSEQHPYNNDHMSLYDPVGNQMSFAFGVDVLSQNEQKMVLENRSLSTKDLRHHIIQRRRTEKRLKLEEDNHERHHGGLMKNGLKHHHRRHESHLRYQEELTRTLIASDEQVCGWGECPRSIRHNSRHCRGPEFKRVWDVASGFGRVNREREFNKKLRHETECVQAKGQIGRWLQHGTGAVDPVLPDQFVGTRGLAQLEAEKLYYFRQQDAFNQINNCQAQRLPLPIQSHLSPAAFIGRACNGNGSLQRSEPTRTPDFEGPKPLSVLLKEKRRRVASAEAEGAKASRTESETGFHGSLNGTLGDCGSFKAPDFEGPKPCNVLLKEKQKGVANGEAKRAQALNFEINEVGIVSLSRNPELSVASLEKNSTCSKKDDSIQNSTSNLPHDVNACGLTSDAKSPCLRKIKDTKIHPVDTDLSLSLSCSREGPKSFVYGCTSDAKVGDSALAGYIGGDV